MFINTPEYETSFFVPFKSGNLVMYSALIEVFKLNNIDYAIIEKTDHEQKNCYLFVRNPLERFFSSYKWYDKIKKEYEQNLTNNTSIKDHKNIIDLFKNNYVNSLSDYIKMYKRFINNCVDFHYLPQTSFFITQTKDNGVRANLNFNFRKEYDDRFKYNNYKIFRVEEIMETIKINNEFLNASAFNFPYIQNETLSNKEIKKFLFLKDFPDNVHYQFMVFYSYFMSYYDTVHHNKNIDYYDTISVDEYRNAYEVFFKEMLFLGYDEEINIKNKKFKDFV